MSAGRNEPCPCGSTKKYKHCCIGKPRAASLGTCSGPGGDPDGRCGKPGTANMTCKLCGKLYAHCRTHQGVVAELIHGHVMRMHPETIPIDRFDRMLRDEAVMTEFRAAAAKAPALWRHFFEYVGERQNGGHARTTKEKEDAETSRILWEATRYRTQALQKRSKPVQWHDGAWEFQISYGEGVKVPGRGAVPMWEFSAKLFPEGRGSAEGDWKRLGSWATAVGVPEGQREVGRTIETAPNATHRWVWTGTATDTDDDPVGCRLW